MRRRLVRLLHQHWPRCEHCLLLFVLLPGLRQRLGPIHLGQERLVDGMNGVLGHAVIVSILFAPPFLDCSISQKLAVLAVHIGASMRRPLTRSS